MNEVLQSAIDKANEVLGKNYVTEPPVNIADIAKNYGLSIKEVTIEQPTVAGFIDPQSKTIYVSSSDSPARKAFTVAHELGHWLLHGDKLVSEPNKYAILYRQPLGESNKDPIEKQANCFAANLLVPKKFLDKYQKDPVYTPEIIADIFGVSKEVIGFRMQDEYARGTL